ncbi:MAG: hypothetical protein WCL04_08500, partial [Verrucomicrobiota bacterium]
GYYYALWFRHTPTPVALWREWEQFIGVVVVDLGPRAWGWAVGISIWLVVAILDFRRMGGADNTRRRASHLLFAVSAGGTIAVLILTGFWKEWQHVRYLLNALLLPLIVLAVTVVHSQAAERFLRSVRAATLATLLLLGTAGVLAATLDPAGWRVQPTPASRDYADLVERYHLRHGLAGYWQTNLFNTLAGPARLNQLQEDARPYFWCNNAFWYFESRESDGTLRWPAYDFILTTGLNRTTLLSRFGPPAQIVRQGKLEIFIYDAVGQERIRARLMPEVIAKLGPSRLHGLRPVP